MRATVVDLRYKMRSVLKALDRNETVTIMYHGKPKGVIAPTGRKTGVSVRAHPFFGMRESRASVAKEMESLRGGRHRDL